MITKLGGGELRIKNKQGHFIDSDTIAAPEPRKARHSTASKPQSPDDCWLLPRCDRPTIARVRM